MAFHSALRELRFQDGLTQSELAKKLGVSKSTISMWEKGVRKPGFEMLEAIADFFNVNMSRLWGDEPDYPASISADGARINPRYFELSEEARAAVDAMIDQLAKVHR